MDKQDGHDGRWVTMNGNHVFIRTNETIEKALARDIKGGEEHGTRKEKQAKKRPSRMKERPKEIAEKEKEFYDKADPGGEFKKNMQDFMKKQPKAGGAGQKYWEGLDDDQKQNIMTRAGLPDHAGISYDEMPANLKKIVDTRAKNGSDMDTKNLKGKPDMSGKPEQLKNKGDPPPKGSKGFAGAGHHLDEADKPADKPWKMTKTGYHTWDAPEEMGGYNEMMAQEQKLHPDSKDLQEYLKSPHGRVPSKDGSRVYYPEDLSTSLGKRQLILNFWDKNPNKTFNPYNDLPDQITAQHHPVDFEWAMGGLPREILSSGGNAMGKKLHKKFRKPLDGSEPYSPKAYSKENPHPAKLDEKGLQEQIKKHTKAGGKDGARFVKAYTKALKQKTGSMSRINTNMNSLKIASMKLKVKN